MASFRQSFLQHDKVIHEGKKPHKCLICDYSCARKDQLKAHINAVHERMKPHKCSICDYSFTTEGNFATLKQFMKDLIIMDLIIMDLIIMDLLITESNNYGTY